MLSMSRAANQKSDSVKVYIGKLNSCLLTASIRTLLSLRNALLIVSPAVEMEKVSGVLWRGRGNYLSTITVSNSCHPSSSPPSHCRFRSVALFSSRFPEELQTLGRLGESGTDFKMPIENLSGIPKSPPPAPSTPVMNGSGKIWKRKHGGNASKLENCRKTALESP